jgi:predicted glycoside hydrolase/deacetylase ChbG (UPF0249 family)
MTKIRLIVNADDYGLTQATNRGIERAHLVGVVTSTTVMANQVAASEAAELRTRCPELGIGIHLTLTLGNPLAPVDAVRSLVDGDGRLLARESLLARLRGGGVIPSHVVVECAAQVQALRGFDLTLDHWDVHQHLHEYSGLGEPITQAMLAESLLSARNPQRARVGRDRLRPRAIMQARRRAPMAGLIQRSFATPDLLLDAPPSRWGEVIRQLPNGVIEAICHPAVSDSTPIDSVIDPAQRAAELAALCDGALRQRFRERGAELATFRSALGAPPSSRALRLGG